MMFHRFIVIIGALCASSALALAQESVFHAGPVFPEYGNIATVDAIPIPEGTKFKVSFDVGRGAKPGEINRSLDSAARFINMHVDAGVPLENLDLALVIHGNAPHDVANNNHYNAVNNMDNANTALVEALLGKGVEIYVCGQSAAYNGVAKEDLLPGVEMSLSAMTAHGLLQQQGYTLNPF